MAQAIEYKYVSDVSVCRVNRNYRGDEILISRFGYYEPVEADGCPDMESVYLSKKEAKQVYGQLRQLLNVRPHRPWGRR